MKELTNRMKGWLEGNQVEPKFLVEIYDFFYQNKSTYYTMCNLFFRGQIVIPLENFVNHFSIKNRISIGVYSIFLNKNEQFYELNKFVHTECLEQNFSFTRKKIVKPYKAYSHIGDYDNTTKN
jgi:hypothetical protein